jgi:hypothetical protein
VLGYISSSEVWSANKMQLGRKERNKKHKQNKNKN